MQFDVASISITLAPSALLLLQEFQADQPALVGFAVYDGSEDKIRRQAGQEILLACCQTHRTGLCVDYGLGWCRRETPQIPRTPASPRTRQFYFAL